MGRNGPVTSMMVCPGTSTLPSPTIPDQGQIGIELMERLGDAGPPGQHAGLAGS